MKIIIVGCGKVGRTLAEQLSRENNDVTVLDMDSRVVEEVASQFDVMGIVGNGASHIVQQEAGVEEADLLIAVTNSDELNLLCCLIAKKAGNCQTIARVRNPEYSKEIDFIKEELGLAMVINPELAAANEIARVLRFPSAIQIDTFAKGRIELLKFKVLENSVLADMPVMDISIKLHCDVLVCAVERGNEVFIPRGDFILKEKDVVSIVAAPKKASEFFKKIDIDTHQVRSAIIAGGGEITLYLAGLLLQMNTDVKIIETRREKCDRLCEILPEALIINGDATDKDVLLESGLEYTGAFVALTNFDEENIMLSLYAKQKFNKKCITKINRISFDEVVNTLDLDTIINPKNITAEYIIQFVRAMKNSIGSKVETVYRIIEDKAEALEFNIKEGASIINIPLEQLSLKHNILIASIIRGGKIITPRGKDMMMVGDSVIVVTTDTGLDNIEDILEKN